MNLSGKTDLLSLLNRFNFNFSKSLGQNFLIDGNILDKIVEGSNIDSSSNVLEIGPGAGTLTRELCKRAKRVVAVEVDKSLVPILEFVMSDFDNFTLINQDIMTVSYTHLDVYKRQTLRSILY